ncbi:MarR family winged helix-turn-helix transcriptional regulator [Sporolactobacillus sp. STCC-11]|uniref:MarR family winged helix-turn-helix transcriptional regulator n=1 Tax=Sporolactobacillus caesalpiniae TaxID=3230362 RepID=UPI0033933A5C
MKKIVDYISRIRRFNRFYTRINGINNQYTDSTEFSSTEAQILYEIGFQDHPTASILCSYFDLDKGYLSRILKKFVKQDLIKKTYLEDDKRVFTLELTEPGRALLDDLIHLSNTIVESKIKKIPEEELNKVLDSMEYIEGILSKYY